ncbi:hypothetical protein BD626DRAFT_502982 [Schizophyllum amplum]|uniref:RNA polymerase II-associated protein 3 n=1 Tax=Schizophyllum amplum TaxID=97359 RepID=A0A550C8P1_9AGAR|nr:hypothetical protein BD626DRAFT_502982 [Auriculariopsis ampla]
MASKAQAAKEQGNSAFKSADYVAAIGHYTKAILADKTDPTFFLNRAAAYLKLGKLEDAERDCTSTLAIDPQNVKALFRRGQARLGIGKLVEATQDLKAALKQEPNNDAVKQELAKVENVFKGEKQSGPSASKPPRRRVPIEIVDDGPPPVRKLVPAEASPSRASAPFEKAPLFQEAMQNRDTLKSTKVGGGLFRTNGNHSLITPRSKYPLPEEEPDKAAPPSSAFAPHAYLASRPTSLFEFTRAWQSTTSAEHRWKYLCQFVDPAALPQLFDSNLEPSMLLSILETAQEMLSGDAGAASKVLSYMDGLSKVSRINVVLLFLNNEERGVVRRLCDTLGDAARVRPWKSVL